MKKYTTVQVEVVRECSDCTNECEYLGRVVGRPGQMDVWKCPEHGKFYEIDGPITYRGYQYTGMYNPRGRNK